MKSREKKTLRQKRNARVQAARKAVMPQWNRCFWTRPFGHVYEVGLTYSTQAVCEFCGKPSYCQHDDVRKMEAAARVAQNFPIARGESKNAVAA